MKSTLDIHSNALVHHYSKYLRYTAENDKTDEITATLGFVEHNPPVVKTEKAQAKTPTSKELAEQAAANQVTEQQVLEQENGESTKVLGDAALVGGEVVDASQAASASSGYFDTARLSRQQSRDNALSLLREAAAQEGAEQAAVDEANQAIQTIAGYTMLESQVESLIVAKGYADCVAFMGEGGISIVVSAAEDGLQTEDVAKITDIVLSETDYTADQITIMEAN